MYFTYVLKSIVDGSLYKGHCENLEVRLHQHNSGMTASIKNRIPFKVVYLEEFSTREEAIKREKYFKTAAGRKFLKTVISS
jgi:putative endonuclease